MVWSPMLLVFVTLVVLPDVKAGGGPLWLARIVDPAPHGCDAFRQRAAREVLGPSAQEAPTPEFACTWSVPGTQDVAQLRVEPKEVLAQAGLTLQAAVERDRPWKVIVDADGYSEGPAHVEGEARADFEMNGLPGWSRTVRTGPTGATTQLTWVSPRGLVTLTYRKMTAGELVDEVNVGSTAAIFINRRLGPSAGLTSMSGGAPR